MTSFPTAGWLNDKLSRSQSNRPRLTQSSRARALNSRVRLLQRFRAANRLQCFTGGGSGLMRGPHLQAVYASQPADEDYFERRQLPAQPTAYGQQLSQPPATRNGGPPLTEGLAPIAK